jgi:hypothetical protein
MRDAGDDIGSGTGLGKIAAAAAAAAGCLFASLGMLEGVLMGFSYFSGQPAARKARDDQCLQ